MAEQGKRIDQFLAPFRGVILVLAVGYTVYAVVHDFQKHQGRVEVQVIASAARAGASVYADGEFVARLPAATETGGSLRSYVRLRSTWRDVYLVTTGGDTVRADTTARGHFAMVDFDSAGLRERRVAMPD